MIKIPSLLVLPACLLLLLTSHAVNSQAVAFEDWTTGLSTYYSGVDGGHCSYGTIATNSFPYGYIVAPNSLAYDDGNACGRCYEVQCVSATTDGCNGCYTDSSTGDNKIITLQVTDECPSCEDSSNQFDLSESAFNEIADMTCGVINMQYRQVSCDISDDIIIRNKDGVHKWWYALFVDNVANYGEISQVEIKDSSSGASWVTGTPTVYNAFIFTSSGGFEVPLSVRLTDGNGNVLTGSDVVTDVESESEFDFGNNFEVGDSTGTSSDTSTDSITDASTDDSSKDTDTSGTDEDTSTDASSDETTISSNIEIQNKDGINAWWYALYVNNVADGNSIASVKMKDSSDSPSYTTGTYTSYGAYVFQASESEWELPFTIRVTNKNGDKLTSKYLISDLNDYTVWDFGSNFDASDDASSRSASESDVADENESLKNEVSALEWGIASCVIVIVVFGAIVGIYCYKSKKNKQEIGSTNEDGFYVPLTETVQ